MEIDFEGKKKRFEEPKSPIELAKEFNADLKGKLVAKVNDELFDLGRKIDFDAKVQLLDFDSKEGKSVLWHSSAHIMAAAVLRLYPHALLGIGPAIDDGFYYDFYNLKIGDNDLQNIEKEMKKIVDEDSKFVRKELSKREAEELFSKNKFKIEILKDVEGKITAYQTGDFLDLCKGPHIPSTRYVKALRLLKVAGAYWKGDSKKEVMTRVYGVSFPSKAQLDEYLKFEEERSKHDHKKIGKELELFMVPELSPGCPIFTPHGASVYNELIRLARELDRKYGYQEIISPMIAKIDMWKVSGHFEKYKDNMYKVTPFSKGEEEYALKPMSCPFSILIFKSKVRSYKDLPLRFSDYGLVHRYELEGALDGLLRTRLIHQQDAHVYVMQEQIESEILRLFDMAKDIYALFDLKPIMVLATRPKDRIGTEEMWDAAESALKNSLEKSGYKYSIKEGDGAFYGPKIDIYVLDFTGRPETAYAVSTIQVDFNLAVRFDAKYIGSDNKEHNPVVIHRSIMGSYGRFMGIILENTSGDLPLWIMPVHARVLSLTERNNKYAEKVFGMINDAGIRVELDSSSSTLEYKVRDAQLKKIPYMIIVGDKEEKAGKIAVRSRDGKTSYAIDLMEFIDSMKDVISKRKFKV